MIRNMYLTFSLLKLLGHHLNQDQQDTGSLSAVIRTFWLIKLSSFNMISRVLDTGPPKYVLLSAHAKYLHRLVTRQPDFEMRSETCSMVRYSWDV
jgi:hypothetical protein